MDGDLLNLGTFINPSSGERCEAFWDQVNSQLILSSPSEGLIALDPIGPIDESLEALASLGISLE